LIPTLITLNDLERRNSLYFPDCLAGQLGHVTVVEGRLNNVRKILSPSSSLPLLAITSPPCSAFFLR